MNDLTNNDYLAVLTTYLPAAVVGSTTPIIPNVIKTSANIYVKTFKTWAKY